MGKVYVPNLVLNNALEFCKKVDEYCWGEDNEFNFINVKRCDPFPMLIVAQKIKQVRSKFSDTYCYATNTDNSYAKNMRFYRFIGMDIGKTMADDYGNENYQPISDLHLIELIKESKDKGIALGELITDTSRKLAEVLSRGDNRMKETMTFCLREMIRNIPEHSFSINGWYCSQYWPTEDLVELALLDDGRGILESINSNYTYATQRLSNCEAIIKAIEPGVSRTYDESGNEEIFLNTGSKWKNSGFGLYVVSRICAKTGGNFILASGDSAVLVKCDNNNQINVTTYDTSISGTAIRIRLRVSGIKRINSIMDEIKQEGGYINGDAFRTASEASSFYYEEEN